MVCSCASLLCDGESFSACLFLQLSFGTAVVVAVRAREEGSPWRCELRALEPQGTWHFETIIVYFQYATSHLFGVFVLQIPNLLLSCGDDGNIFLWRLQSGKIQME